MGREGIVGGQRGEGKKRSADDAGLAPGAEEEDEEEEEAAEAEGDKTQINAPLLSYILTTR